MDEWGKIIQFCLGSVLNYSSLYMANTLPKMRRSKYCKSYNRLPEYLKMSYQEEKQLMRPTGECGSFNLTDFIKPTQKIILLNL